MKINLLNFKYSFPTNKKENNNKALKSSSCLQSCRKADLLQFSNFSFTSFKPLTNKDVIFEMEKLVSKKNYDKNELIRLFSQMPKNTQDRVNATVEKFSPEGLVIESYLEACVHHPLLFSQLPETTESNVRNLVDKLSADGLTTEMYLSACLRYPQLLSRSADTIESHFKSVIKKFEQDGLTTEAYLKTCIKQPSLMGQAPETIESNVKDLVKKFEQDGLTVKSYLKACLKTPQLFYQSPETIEANVRGLVKKFNNSGLSVKSYLKACLKQPSLFHQSPELIAQHINAFKYCALNKNNSDDITDIVESKNLAYSTSLIYLQGIVKPQLQKQCPELSDLKADGIKPALKRYFQDNPNASFNLEILNTPMAQNFIETMQDWTKKDLNREDVFNYYLV